MGRLFWKILITFWVTLLVAGAISGVAVWLHQRSMQDMTTNLVVRPASFIAVQAAANTLKHGGIESLRGMLIDQRDSAPEAVQVYAVDAQGNELLNRTVLADTLALAREGAAKNIEPPLARLVQKDNKDYVLFAPRSGQFPQYNQLKTHTHRPPDDSWLSLIVSGILASFVSSLLLAWYFSHPIHSLRRAFGALAEGDLNQRVAVEMGSRRDEIADLGKDFDDMASQLQSLMASQKRLLHDVSHELRSPLARLQVSIGLARQQPDKMEATLERIEQEAGRLDALVGELLTLSRLEAGVAPAMDEYLDIQELLDTVVEAAEFEAQVLACRVSFSSELEESPVYRGHGELLYRALENVIRNAIHHTAPNTEVSIHLSQSAQSLRIIVDDQGTGVPETELGHIFEPFQRSSQTIKTNGYGLGLAIAKRAITSHGGTIQASNRAKGGLRVEINLPWQTEKK